MDTTKPGYRKIDEAKFKICGDDDCDDCPVVALGGGNEVPAELVGKDVVTVTDDWGNKVFLTRRQLSLAGRIADTER
jgi:hypothetical protein